MRKWIIIIILIIAAIVGYNYVYQDHRDIQSETSLYSLSSKQLQNEFKAAPNQSEQKYLNKTIEVSGTITELNETDLTLNNHVFCALNVAKHKLKEGLSIKVKGRVIGYDNLLEQIKLDQCTLID